MEDGPKISTTNIDIIYTDYIIKIGQNKIDLCFNERYRPSSGSVNGVESHDPHREGVASGTVNINTETHDITGAN